MSKASQVESLFFAALEKGDADERAAFLDAECGGDAELRGQVERLLTAHPKVSDFLKNPIVELLSAPERYDATQEMGLSTDGEDDAPPSQEPLMTRTEADQAGQADDDGETLQFLSPSTRPGALGRIGHYDVLEVLGKGGFGIVFRAFDDVLQRVVAVKVMAPSIAATSPARKRFLREARSSAQVRHESVVQVYEVGEQPLPYLVMEYIPGETLQQRLDRMGPLDAATIVRIGRQIAEGLAAAHATGLIHRDIKPSNMLIETSPQQRVKITDFGLARAADDASLTRSGVVAGTPMYMSPEQATGESFDHRADLFSLGSVLYVMATGRPPFRASTTFAVLKRVAEDEPRPIREVIPEVPEWLCAIVAKLHAKDPAARFQTAREVADLLADCEAKLKSQQEINNILPAAKRDEGRGASGARKWLALAAVLLPMVALTATEFAGVTELFHGQRATNDPIKPRSAPTPVPVAQQEAPPLAVVPFDAAQAKKHQEAWAKHLGVPVEFSNSLGMTFRLIPPGEFLMGIDSNDVDTSKWNTPVDWPANFLGEFWPNAVAAASPKHPVKLTRAFYIQTHEVRHGWYRKMLGPIPELDPAADPDSPVTKFVSWPDTIAFCNALSKQEARRPCYAVAGDEVTLTPDGDGYRLPTEAEWEFACRAGTNTPWFFGENPVEADTHALDPYVSSNTKTPSPNGFGLFDMYAGSTEWVWDGYESYRLDAVVDPVVVPGHNRRLTRGSSSYASGGRAFWSVNSFSRWVDGDFDKRSGFAGFGRVVISIPVPVKGERSAFRLVGGRLPFTDADVQRIIPLSAEKQLDAIAEELAKRNPGLDVATLKASAQFDDGKLIVVELRAPYLADLSPLQALPAIPLVRLQGTNGVNLATLAGSTMGHLSLDGKITDLSPLPRLQSLKVLEVQCPTLTDVAPLKGWQLRGLNLHNSNVEDLSPLTGMPLNELNIHRTKVKDLFPLKGMKLDTIRYRETDIQDIAVLQDMPLRIIECDYLRRRDEAVLRAIPTLKSINGKSPEEFWKDVNEK